MQEKIEGEMGIKIIFPSSRKEESISMFLVSCHFVSIYLGQAAMVYGMGSCEKCEFL